MVTARSLYCLKPLMSRPPVYWLALMQWEPPEQQEWLWLFGLMWLARRPSCLRLLASGRHCLKAVSFCLNNLSHTILYL
ncbi:MAG: hypothetical protein OEV08_06625, partial [Nitrospira sp.]|nr:hypothetical protein [Nitrospira sp.]